MKSAHFRPGHDRRRRVTRNAFALAAAAVLFVLAAPAKPQAIPTSVIRVKIDGLHSDKGQVMCALFSSAKDFPRNADNAVARTQSAIAQGKAVCEFNGVVPGRYAVSIFHDENSNGKLDRNFMGIPREGVGASNNAIGHFGPPKFDAAAFTYSGGRLELAIKAVYL